MWNDPTFFIYFLLVIFSAYDATLFCCWAVYVWFKEKKRMSTVFFAISALFVSLLYAFSLNLWIRHIRFENEQMYIELMKKPFWAYRHIITVFLLVLIGFFMTRRWILSMRNGNLKGGKRDSDHI